MYSHHPSPFKWRSASLLSVVALSLRLISPAFATAKDTKHKTQTPIKHVIIIIGENRTFDHIFATYKPKAGETVSNLLSKGIVNEDGPPGPNFSLASQSSASDTSSDGFLMSPTQNVPYSVLPPVLAGGYSTAPFPDVATAKKYEYSLPNDYYVYLTTGGTGLAHGAVDTRVPNATSLPSGPFQLTSATLPYDSYANSPVHRFYQMWQQADCNAANATHSNPSGCRSDLFPWVEVTVGAGTNGYPQPSGFNEYSTKEGSTSMGFYNMLQGDAPYLKSLADNYSMSDNFHQSVMGGTGANHVMLGTGDAIFWSDGKGNPTTPPSHITNPDPLPNTDDVYTVDLLFDGNFTECGDLSQPGIKPIHDYLASLPYRPDSKCQPGRFYMVNNDAPGFLPDGTVDTAGIAGGGSIPPTNVRTIGEALNEKGVSWA